MGAFIGRGLLWLPACYAAWHFTGAAWAWAAGVTGRAWLALVQPWLVTGMDANGHALTLVTTAELRLPGGSGHFLAEIDAGVYTHGMALFAALMLASRARPRLLLAGLCALVPFQGFGIAMDLLAQLLRLGPAALSAAGIPAGWSEAIALGYQFGSLMLPSLAPVALWAWFNRPFLASRSSTRFAPSWR